MSPTYRKHDVNVTRLNFDHATHLVSRRCMLRRHTAARAVNGKGIAVNDVAHEGLFLWDFTTNLHLLRFRAGASPNQTKFTTLRLHRNL